jgi:hypothetical protein
VTLLGETVNIPARLEALAELGGVCLSEDTYRRIRNRLTEPFIDLGDKRLKNIARPIRAYAIPAMAATSKPLVAQPAHRSRGRKLPAPIPVRAPTLRGTIDTLERACAFIDKNVPPDLAKLPRRKFARALFVEASRRRRLATDPGNQMAKDCAEATRTLAWLRRLITYQQRRINRQRELIAQLETETPKMPRLRAAGERLRHLIESHDATLREAASAQEALICACVHAARAVRK